MTRVLTGVVLLALMAAPPARAQPVTPEESLVLDRWEIVLGAFATGLNTQVRFDEVVGNQGTTVNLEDDLGFDDSEGVFSMSVAGMIGKRHHLELAYLEVDRTGFVTTQFEIQWGDEIFPVNSELDSFYDAEFIALDYTYWVRSRERSAWGPTFGLVMFSTGSGVTLRGTAQIGDGIDIAGSDIEVDVPIPLIGIRWRQAVADKWVFLAGGSFIDFEDIDDFTGDVITGKVAVEYRAWDKFGFGLGWRIREFDVDSGERRTLGQYKFELRGFYLYGRIGV